jgi:adenylate cyclase
LRDRVPGRKGPPLAAGLLVTAFLAGICLYPPPFVSFLDMKAYDSLLRISAHRAPTGEVVVADLDEASLARYGQWPWPRYRVAALLSRIRSAGATAVGIDVLFAEPDRTSLSLLTKEIRDDLGVDIVLGRVPPEAIDGDRTLAAALAGGPFILGYQFDFESARGDGRRLHPLRVAIHARGGEPRHALPDAQRIVGNLPVLEDAAAGSGFFNVVPDADGVLRRVPMIVRHRGNLFAGLALATYLHARGGDVVLETGPGGLESFRLGGRELPLDPRGNMLVDFRGPRRTIPHVSAGAILGGRAAPEALRGKIVVFGTTAAGLVDIRTTPLDTAHPGPEIQATVIDNLVAGDPLSMPPWARPVRLLAVLALGVFLASLTARAHAATAIVLAAAAIAASWSGAWWLLARYGIFLSPVLPAATSALVFSVTASMRFAWAEREVRVRERRLARTQDAIILSLASLAETRHKETGGHINRTRHYMRALALALRKNPRYSAALDDETVDLLFRLAPLHDIGKVGVRDSILLKETQLTVPEYEEMKRHTLYGSETIRAARDFLGGDTFLSMADDIVRTHQERWDGTGYPEGLKGEAIPLAGRLMAVADVYDALISVRGYKGEIPHETAIGMMVAERGTHFDPDVIDALLTVREEFRRIAGQYAGGGVEPEPPASCR